MSSPSHTFLTLIPTAHRVANISPFTSPVENAAAAAEESLIPALQKTRRSSSTATTESNSAAEEPSLPSTTETAVVESPAETVAGPQFLKLGN